MPAANCPFQLILTILLRAENLSRRFNNYQGVIEMKLFFSILALSVFGGAAFGQTLKAPSGWRFPSAKDYQGDWKIRRKDGTRPFKALGDFNNDKVRDEAWILIPTGGTAGAGLFVFLGHPNKTFRIVQLDYLEGAKAQSLYVELAPKGEYETACGKGYWNCAASGEPAKLNLKFQAISYGTFESSETIYYWDVQAKTFRNAAISD
jgi:hypothetical protein